MKHTLSWMDEKGNVKIAYRPVHSTPLDSDMPEVPPVKRVY